MSNGEWPEDELFKAGLRVRGEVLGASHVERSLARTTPFDRDFVELITRSVWGSIWTRPGLDRRTRRLIVLAITASLGRWEEFELHVRAALQGGGLTEEDIKEVLLQTALYAGVPAGNNGFRIAAAILKEASDHDPSSQP